MKIRILLGLLLVMLFTSGAVNAQHYRHGYRGHRSGVYVRTPRAVVVVNGGPRYHRGYGHGYRRGYYGRPGYRRGYYGHAGYRRGYYGHRRHYHGRGW